MTDDSNETAAQEADPARQTPSTAAMSPWLRHALEAALTALIGAALLGTLDWLRAPLVPHRLYYLETRIPALDPAAVASRGRPVCQPPAVAAQSAAFENQVTMIQIINPLRRDVNNATVSFRPKNTVPILHVATGWDGDFGSRTNLKALTCDEGQITAQFSSLRAEARFYLFVAAANGRYEVDSDEDEGAVVSGGDGRHLSIVQLKEDDYRRFAAENEVYFAAGVIATIAGLLLTFWLVRWRRRRIARP